MVIKEMIYQQREFEFELYNDTWSQKDLESCMITLFFCLRITHVEIITHLGRAVNLVTADGVSGYLSS